MAGRANRLVGFLGVLDLRLVDPRLRPADTRRRILGDQSPGVVDRHLRQVGRVGTHVGDVAVFVQALGDLHRAPGGEAELAVGFLLQRAGGERRVRLRGVRLVFDVRDAELAAANPLGQRVGRRPRRAASSRVFLSLPVAESKSLPAGILRPSTETSSASSCLPSRLGELAEQVPPRRRDERHPLAARARRSAAPRRSARGRPRASAAPSATAAARLRSRTAGRECGAFPGPAPGRRRRRAGWPAPPGSRPS